MKDPKIKTKIIHSGSKPAWNIIGEKIGGKFKIARIPYHVFDNEIISNENRKEAREHAEFINACFNLSDKIYNEIIK